MSYADNIKQANREAVFAVVSLVATVIVWLLLGYGLEGCGIYLFETPLWILAGCFGTWIFSMLIAAVFSAFVMKDCDLDAGDEDDADETNEGQVR